MTERYARDPDPGLAGRLVAWLFPPLCLDAPGAPQHCFPCIDHDHAGPEPEPEAEP